MVDGAVWGVLNIEAVEPEAFRDADVGARRDDRREPRQRRAPAGGDRRPGVRLHDDAGGDNEHRRGEGRLHRKPRRGRRGDGRARGAAHGAASTEVRDVRYAAMLHDVGKIAVPERDPAEAGAADRAGVGADARPRRGRRRTGRADRRLRSPGPGGASQPRALGRRRLPGRPGGRGDPPRGEDHHGLRHLRRDHHRPPVPSGAHLWGGARGARARRGHAARRRVVVALCASWRRSASDLTAVQPASGTHPTPIF